MLILLGVGALILRRCALRVLIWIAFSLFVLGPLLCGYGGDDLRLRS